MMPDTFTHMPMNAIDALKWCRRHNGTIRFEVDGTVTLIAYGVAKRGESLGYAMTAMQHAIREGREPAAAVERWYSAATPTKTRLTSP